MCSFTESSRKSEGQEEEPSIIADVAAPYQEEDLPQGVGTSSLAFPCFPTFIVIIIFLPPFLTLSAFANTDTSAKDLELVVTEVIVEPAPNVQVVEA